MSTTRQAEAKLKAAEAACDRAIQAVIAAHRAMSEAGSAEHADWLMRCANDLAGLTTDLRNPR